MGFGRMRYWWCIRKLSKFHIVPFYNHYVHLPTTICLTYDEQWHIGWFNMMLEVGRLEIK